MKKSIRRFVWISGAIFLGLAVVGFGGFAILNNTNGDITVSGVKREYLLYVPTSYDPGVPTPLVISMHGFAEWPAHQMDVSHWNQLADEHGFIVVYPSGTGFPLRWKINDLPGAEVDLAGEVEFISALIDKLASEYNLDLSRVYANGLSNGGGMADMLGCRLSERITAIGSVAGAYLYPRSKCNPGRPVPVIAFHGTADEIVPYEGGKSMNLETPFPPVPEWALSWAELNGCQDEPEHLPAFGDAGGIQYIGCDQDARVILYTIAGGGHSWPGGEPLPEFIVGSTSTDIDATRVMWEFFSNYSLSK